MAALAEKYDRHAGTGGAVVEVEVVVVVGAVVGRTEVVVVVAAGHAFLRLGTHDGGRASAAVMVSVSSPIASRTTVKPR